MCSGRPSGCWTFTKQGSHPWCHHHVASCQLAAPTLLTAIESSVRHWSSYPFSCFAYFEPEFSPGVWKGTVLTGWRLLRCNPWGGRGYDPPVWPPKGLEAVYGQTGIFEDLGPQVSPRLTFDLSHRPIKAHTNNLCVCLIRMHAWYIFPQLWPQLHDDLIYTLWLAPCLLTIRWRFCLERPCLPIWSTPRCKIWAWYEFSISRSRCLGREIDWKFKFSIWK